ncbi:MAG: hypothetical protein P9M03_12410 [Candidatus Theseobacter exili]|nr:hypothetical protein [Candidatus Theseobacter exili]
MSFKLAVYVETNGINILKEKVSRERFDNYLKQLEIEKIYLDIFRGDEGEIRFSGKFLKIDDIKSIKEYYEKKGIEIAGGLCIGTWREGFGKQSIDQNGQPMNFPCYSSKETRNLKSVEILSREGSSPSPSIALLFVRLIYSTCQVGNVPLIIFSCLKTMQRIKYKNREEIYLYINIGFSLPRE